VRAGFEAQCKAIVLLKNSGNVLPLRPQTKLYPLNLDPSAFSSYAQLVSDPAQADVLIVKVNAPYVTHKGGGNFFKETHEGTLA
jgi:beta-glucosidase